MKAVGAAYLIYLGLDAIFNRREPGEITDPDPRDAFRLFKDGVLVSVLNPKIAVFFLAFLPQFASPSSGSVTLQVTLLGLLYAVLAFFTDSAYALLAGWLRSHLTPSTVHGPVPRYASGTVYIGLGLSTAFSDSR